MNSCLMVVDLQNDYFPGGRMPLVGIEDAAANARLLLDAFRKRHLPVIHIRHLSTRPDATFFLPGTDGAEINTVASPWEAETVVVKNFPNSFRATPLLDLLQAQNIDRLIICGAMSHMCIDATTRAAFDLGFPCVVAADACATKDLTFGEMTIEAAEVHASFMAALSGLYARVIPTAEVIAGLGE
jgi:nicotinamidase-related amidase